MESAPQGTRLWVAQATARPRLRAWLPTAIVLVVLLAIAIAASVLLRDRQIALRRALIAERATGFAAHLREQIETPLETARSAVSLFAASDLVTRDEFRRFVVTALAREPQVYSFEWAPRVAAADRAALEAGARAEGLADYQVREPGPDGKLHRAAERGEYLPLLFVEPQNAALGFDLGSRTDLRERLDTACRTAAPAATHGMRLVQDTAETTSVVAYIAVWREGNIPDNAGERCRTYLGIVGLVFRISAVVNNVIEQLDAGDLDVVLREQPDPAAEAAAASGGSASAVAAGPLYGSRAGAAEALAESEWGSRREVRFADRVWTLEVAPIHPPSILVPYVVLGLGVIGALLAAAQAGGLRQMRELRRQVRDARRFGQYFLEEEIGRGGMGVVYRAHHVLMQRATAIKVLSPEVSSPELIARFEREVQLTCQLTHPNTIAIYDYGRTRDGEFYYVMEYVDGITFDHLVRHDGRQPIGRAVHLVRQVCSALREAHGTGIIHRDLNPANLMLTVRGAVADVVKVLDFGLVKKMMPGELGIPSVDPASMPMAVSGASRLASTVQTVAARPSAPRSPGPTARQGLFLGAAGYASPEVIVGGTTDARSDLYGLGAVWFLLLAGRPAFDDLGTTAIFTAQMRDEPPRPSSVRPDIPPPIDDLVARCLSRDPGKRPQSVDEILAVLEGPELPGWTVEEAGTWWRSRAPVVRAKIVRGHVGVETRDTIDVRVEREEGAEVAGEVTVVSGPRKRA